MPPLGVLVVFPCSHYSQVLLAADTTLPWESPGTPLPVQLARKSMSASNFFSFFSFFFTHKTANSAQMLSIFCLFIQFLKDKFAAFAV